MDALANVPRRGRAVPRRLLRLRSDLALAARFAEGDDAAFAVLYERHRKSVLAVCMGVLGSRHDAEDAAQDAFTALAVSLRKSLPANVPAWLTRIARNAAIDVARRRRSDPCGENGIADQVISGESFKAELESVLAGIRELPEAQRTALLMRELAGHSYREIAALLEVDETAVSGLIARARISLRSHREAAEMSCARARLALAAEPSGRHPERAVRRHVRACASCRAYQRALRADAKALRCLIPDPALPLAGGGAVFGIGAKAALLGATASQVTAACAVSVCAVGGVVLLASHPVPHEVRSSRGADVRATGVTHHRRSSPAREARVVPAQSGAATPAGPSSGRVAGGRATVLGTSRGRPAAVGFGGLLRGPWPGAFAGAVGEQRHGYGGTGTGAGWRGQPARGRYDRASASDAPTAYSANRDGGGSRARRSSDPSASAHETRSGAFQSPKPGHAAGRRRGSSTTGRGGGHGGSWGGSGPGSSGPAKGIPTPASVLRAAASALAGSPAR
jgi:RNA polymerase sigma factor (sigma-70 family)